MSTITLPNIRVSSDLTIRLKLKDGGVAIDWSTLQNIRVSLYADDQRSMASRCNVSIDEEDSTILVCQYAANKMQYLGVNRVIVQCKYMGEVKTYDKPAFTFVRWTSDQEGEQITIDDPDVDVEISVEDVSSSILQEAVDAAFDAADRANDAAAAAEHMVDIHTGPEGKSAYEVAVEEGYTGTEEEWLASLKGPVGETPDISIGTVTTVEPGTPAAASMTGTPEAPVLNLSIPKGLVGATPNFTVGTVTTGEPGSSVIVTITGTPEAPVLNVTIPQGMQGNTGSSVEYPYELVNNLTTNDATKGLSAAQGYVLDGKVSQLEAKVDDLSTGKYYGYFAKEEDLPEADVDGFAYVGEGPTYTIYNLRSGVWTSSDITVNQSPIGNEEDIDQNEDGKLQFANRAYDSVQPNGMGYKILRDDATFNAQVTEENTIYEIRYDFDMGGMSKQIPAGCVLKFNGGKIKNGSITGEDTVIDAPITHIFEDVVFYGTWGIFSVFPEWFGAKGDGVTDDRSAIEKALGFKFVSFLGKTYLVDADGDATVFTVLSNTQLTGEMNSTVIQFKNTVLDTVCFELNGDSISLKDISIYGVDPGTPLSPDALVSIGIKHHNSARATDVGRNLFLENVKLWYHNTGAVIASYLNRIRWVECNSCNTGIHLHSNNITLTSNTLENCYARNVLGSGYVIDGVIYSSFISCAADSCDIAYEIKNCYSVSFVGCGSEMPHRAISIETCKSLSIDGFYLSLPNDTTETAAKYEKMIYLYKTAGIIFTGMFVNIGGSNQYKTNKFIYLESPSSFIYSMATFIGCTCPEKSLLEAITLGTGSFSQNTVVFFTSYQEAGPTGNRPSLDSTVKNYKYYDRDILQPIYWNGSDWRDYNGFLPLLKKGATSARPSSLNGNYNGNTYYDTTIKRMLIYDNSIGWIGLDGLRAGAKGGATTDRPTLGNTDVGYLFYDTTLGKAIVWNGSAWVNMDGTALS